MESQNNEQEVVKIEEAKVAESVQSLDTPKQENFFDRHATLIIFLVNFLCNPGTPFALALLPGFSFIGSNIEILSSIASIVFLVSIILATINYRGKRKEILRGVALIMLFTVAIALVGLGLCFLLFSSF